MEKEKRTVLKINLKVGDLEVGEAESRKAWKICKEGRRMQTRQPWKKYRNSHV